MEAIYLLNRDDQYVLAQKKSSRFPFGYNLSDIFEVRKEHCNNHRIDEHLTASSMLKEMIELCQVSGLKLSAHPSLGSDFEHIVKNASSLRLTDDGLEIIDLDGNSERRNERSCQALLRKLSIYNLKIRLPGTQININRIGNLSGNQFISFSDRERSQITLDLMTDANDTQQRMQDVITTNRVPIKNDCDSYDITNISSFLIEFTSANQVVSELTFKIRVLYDAISQYRIKLEDDIHGNHRLLKSKAKDMFMFWDKNRPEESRGKATQLRTDKFELLFRAQNYLSMPSSQEAYNEFYEAFTNCSNEVINYGANTKSLIKQVMKLAENDYHLERPVRLQSDFSG
ncbi:hypothetical protein [Legionella tunisiensis]|uniref:hypothetical protein n=1 Tax=Legionella tunisiensis TaxID=1034944 RepID=UPI000301AC74|nr:hypothetical protein [Legionella tunisiensis]